MARCARRAWAFAPAGSQQFSAIGRKAGLLLQVLHHHRGWHRQSAGQPWTSALAPDQKGTFEPFIARPLGEEPNLGFGRPDTFGQKEQALGTAAGFAEMGKDLVERVKVSF